MRDALGVLMLLGIVGVVVGGLSSAILFAWLSRTLPDPNNIRTRQVAQSTKIFDREGKELLYEIHGEEKRTVVELEDIPEHVRNATIAIEDKNFYEHRGFRLRSLMRAVIVNVIQRRKAQGGSTITQQLVKNAVLTNQKSFARKIKELFLAYEIERRFTKDEILKLYFNEIPYGSNAYGIEAASQTYFGKSARDLDVLEGAMLAAVPKAPTFFSPYGAHTDELVARTHLVVSQMEEQGFVSHEEAENAKAGDLLARIKPKREAIRAPHFVLYIKEILTEKYGERQVEQGGLRVITSLDWSKQQNAEKAIEERFKAVETYGGSNAALVALDPKTGDILAMVGSRDYFNKENDGNVNVTLRPRQPGSSIKPVVYAAAFEKGYTPNTVLYDVDTIFKPDGREYHPRNYDLKEHGPVTARTALAGSLNIPAVKITYLTGIGRVIDFAERLGYTTWRDRSRFGLSIVLGGAEVRPIEHAAAFGTFAANGIYRAPRPLLRVEDAKGNLVDEWPDTEGNRVIEPEVARLTTNILSDNNARAFVFGAQNYLTLGDRPVAAKTGTTNEFRDAWTVGYTPSLVAVVWTGNNDNKAMKSGADGSRIAAPIWQQFMRESLKGTPVEGFAQPAPITTGKPVLDGTASLDKVVKIDRASGLLATEYTPPAYVQEIRIPNAHSILHFLDKDDPRGPAPTNPAADPEYAGWEAAVASWLGRKGTPPGSDIQIPTAFDPVHIPANVPTVRIDSPWQNATINGRTLDIAVDTSSPRGVRRVEVLVDGAFAGVLTHAPWQGSFTLPSKIGVGFHTVEVRAYDDVDNMGSARTEINVTTSSNETAVFWTAPSGGAVLSKESFPIAISASLGSGDVTRATFVIKSAGGSYHHNPGTFENPGTSLMSAQWSLAPAPGTYYLGMEITRTDGSVEKLSEQVPLFVQ